MWQIVAFVRSLSEKSKGVQLPGDAGRGGALVRGKGGCLQCHMVGGEGGRAGLQSYEIIKKPAMPSYEWVLSEGEIDDIVAYLVSLRRNVVSR